MFSFCSTIVNTCPGPQTYCETYWMDKFVQSVQDPGRELWRHRMSEVSHSGWGVRTSCPDDV